MATSAGGSQIGALYVRIGADTSGLDAGVQRASASLSGVARAARVAVTALASVGAALSVVALKNYADAWSDLQSQIGASTGDMANAARQMSRLVDIANASYSPLAQTVEGYTRNVSALRDLGRSSSDAADFTESLNHMLVLTATRGQRAASVQDALSKAMAVGRLQAQGLETVLANGGEVAQALANELGTTVSGLRDMASQGKITGEVIASAIIGSLDDVRDRAAEMPATIGDALTRVQTNMMQFVGRIDQASGASSALAGMIIRFADAIRTAGNIIIQFGQFAAPAFSAVGSAISTVTQYADIAIAALAGFAAPALIGGVVALTSALAVGLVGAINAVTAAMLANPIGAITAALVAAGYAAYKFRDEIYEYIGIDVVDTARSAANTMIGSFVAAYENIKFVWKNFGNMMGAAVVGGVNIAIRAINGLISASVSGIDSLIAGINNTLGTELGLIGGALSLGELENPYSDKLAEEMAALGEVAGAAMAKDYIGALADAFNGEAEYAGELDPVLSVSDPGGGGGGIAAGLTAGMAQANEQQMQQLQQRLEALRTHLASEEELEIKSHLDRQEQLREIWENGLVTDEERRQMALDLEEQHQEALTEIHRRGEEERIAAVERAGQAEKQMRASVVQNAIALLDQFAGKSKAAALASIALSKGQMIAQAIQSTAAAKMRAIAELGPVAGPPMAAKIGVMGALNVGLIAATGLAQAAGALSSGSNLSGGASGSVGGQSSPPSSSVPAAAPQSPAVTINIGDGLYSGKAVRDLIGAINEAVGDGARLRIA